MKLCVLSRQGKEAVVGVLVQGSFFGEGCLVGQRKRMATATALGTSTIARIEKAAMIRVLHDESSLPSCLWPICCLAMRASKRTELIISSIRPRSGGANPSVAGSLWERR